MDDRKNIENFDQYLGTVAQLILDSNYTTKEEVQSLLSAHFGIMLLEAEKPINNDLKIQYDKKLQYLRQLETIGSPKINMVKQELTDLKNRLKESNKKIYTADNLNQYGAFKEFIRAKFGTALISEFYDTQNYTGAQAGN
jgi:DNA-directed RNA polymerase subunit F